MLKFIRSAGQSYMLGNASLFIGKPPAFVKYHGVWPRIRVIFSNTRESVSKLVSYRGKQFSASLPSKTLALPEQLRVKDNEEVCSRSGPLEFFMDFTSRLEPVDAVQEQKAAILAEAGAALHLYAQCRQQYETLGGSLEKDLGVKIVWLAPP
jgi:hypothetical protein